MNSRLIPFLSESTAITVTGSAEVLYATLLLIFYKSKHLMYPTIAFSVLVTLALAMSFPSLFTNAFNPFSINLSLFSLGLVNILSGRNSSSNQTLDTNLL